MPSSKIHCEPLCQFGDRLFFTTFPEPAPSATAINKLASIPGNNPPLRPNSRADPDATYHYFTIDDRLLYFSFYKDWGPLNIAMVYKACILIHELLEELPAPQRIVLYSSSHPTKRANAALLIALYALIVQRWTPWEAFQPIAEMEFIPFRDAGRGPSDFNLNIQDCLWGIWKAMQNGLCDMNQFDVEEYEYYEKVENGDWNWISPHFIAFASPVDTCWIKKEKEQKANPSGPSQAQTTPKPLSSSASSSALQRKLPVPFLNCLDYFEKRNVKVVIRLNTELYDRTTFLERGIDHMELYFDDGTNPTDEIVRTFLDVADRIINSGGVVAVHCKAGLGRTGTLIGAYLIWKFGFTAGEAIAFMRILRPGCVVGPQQQFMYLKQLEWIKWAAADEIKRQQEEASAASKALPIVTPATPPADTDDDDMPSQTHSTPSPSPKKKQPLMPPVTPSRHVAEAAAKAREIATPGQPRKTSAKRAAPDSDAEEEEDDVLPLSLETVGAKLRQVKPKASKAASEQRPTRVTRSNAAALRKPPVSPTKVSSQRPNKIPRLATTTKSTGTTKAVAATQQAQPSTTRRNQPTPTPSRLPTLVKRATTLTEVAATVTLNKGVSSAEWMNTNAAAAVVVQGAGPERTDLRKVRRRRSSFSAVDVVV